MPFAAGQCSEREGAKENFNEQGSQGERLHYVFITVSKADPAFHFLAGKTHVRRSAKCNFSFFSYPPLVITPSGTADSHALGYLYK